MKGTQKTDPDATRWIRENIQPVNVEKYRKYFRDRVQGQLPDEERPEDREEEKGGE